MEAAAEVADLADIITMLQDIREHAPVAADELLKSAQAFAYDDIGELVQQGKSGKRNLSPE